MGSSRTFLLYRDREDNRFPFWSHSGNTPWEPCKTHSQRDETPSVVQRRAAGWRQLRITGSRDRLTLSQILVKASLRTPAEDSWRARYFAALWHRNGAGRSQRSGLDASWVPQRQGNSQLGEPGCLPALLLCIYIYICIAELLKE